MNHLSMGHALLLGFIQGIAAYLPISSIAHLRLATVLGHFPDPGAGFDAVIQVGSAIAVVIYFWKDLGDAFKGWFKGLTDPSVRNTPESKMGWAVFIGTIPVIIAGVLLKDQIETSFRDLRLVAWSFIGLSVVMWAADIFSKKSRDLPDIQAKDGVIPGLLQCLALAPGMSRSGGTITGGFLLGYNRRAATRLSFLMGVPAIVAAGLFELVKDRHELIQAGLLPTLVASIVSLVVSWVSIRFLLEWVAKYGVALFAVYRILLGICLLWVISAGWMDPMAGVKPASHKTPVTKAAHKKSGMVH
jgi:undecaprenyl-diphosphatase